MFQLLYTSIATRPLSRANIETILRSARASNADLDVTGVLTYAQGEFMQVLEGREAIVRALYEIIARDPRHRDCQILVETTVPARQFPSWSMGYFEPPRDEDELLSTLGVRRLDRRTVERLSYDTQLCQSVMYGLLRCAAERPPAVPA